ncbi:cytochrome P450 [Streptomyces sp. NBC_00539]|uniref:cytochrome P450 n=1 Tax=Streptomyces sp. NBC_00539 TaxID=2975770 RepID=UPI002E80EDD4|nr:cytochrome P450 [Streptomyces sp. NBC_00539]WUC63581.1 cytochrome P450 [Streptomyces sp. NBC_00539]
MIQTDAHPTVRHNAFDPPAELAKYRENEPVRRMRYPDGHIGWLVTSHALGRKLLADQRFSARSEFKRAPVSRPGADPFYGAKALPGWLVDMDPPEHTRLRQQLAGKFTARRMREMRPQIERIVDGLLDAMAERGGPVDLVEAFALPVPSLMICELLGVPYSERAAFQRNSEILFSLNATAAEASEAMDRLYGFLRGLAADDGDGPGAGDGTGLLAMLAADGTLDAEEIAGVGVLLLTAGHESTSSSLSLSTLALLAHPDQLAVFRDDPSITDNAVEELLRHLSVFHFGVPRTPLEDVEFEGHLFRRGESVTVSIPAANRDPAWFEDPDRLDFTRKTAGHMAFGYGIHQCLGQNLVRMEMRTALPALFRRFPTLALAVPPEEVPLAADMSVYGVHRLPVTW